MAAEHLVRIALHRRAAYGSVLWLDCEVVSGARPVCRRAGHQSIRKYRADESPRLGALARVIALCAEVSHFDVMTMSQIDSPTPC